MDFSFDFKELLSILQDTSNFFNANKDMKISSIIYIVLLCIAFNAIIEYNNFIQHKSTKINYISSIIKTIIAICMALIISLIIRINIFMIISPIFSSIASLIIYYKIFVNGSVINDVSTQIPMESTPILTDNNNTTTIQDTPPPNSIASDNQFYNNTGSAPIYDDMLDDNELPTVNSDYFDPNDIIDILFVYRYISQNQRSKLYDNNLISNNPDELVRQILNMQAVTDDELEEAIVIRNLIKKSHHLVTKEDALKELLKKKRTVEENDS